MKPYSSVCTLSGGSFRSLGARSVRRYLECVDSSTLSRVRVVAGVENESGDESPAHQRNAARCVPSNPRHSARIGRAPLPCPSPPTTRHPLPHWLPLVLGLLTALPAPAQDKPFPPGEAAKHMIVPDGFHVTLLAGEPDVVQPIAFTIDDRGRLWVVESYSYPDWRRDGKEGRDRILIFEDRDGDGRFDTCKVFWDKGANISGIQVGFGGVWL